MYSRRRRAWVREYIENDHTPLLSKSQFLFLLVFLLYHIQGALPPHALPQLHWTVANVPTCTVEMTQRSQISLKARPSKNWKGGSGINGAGWKCTLRNVINC